MAKTDSRNISHANAAAGVNGAGQRVVGLDGLRGIAALVVVVFHYTMGYGTFAPAPGFFSMTPLHLFWDGSAAVSLFFVLSGFVLSYGYLGAGDERQFHVGRFYLSRALRLLMPYVGAFLISAVCVHYLFSHRATDPVGRVPMFFIEWIKAASLPVSDLLLDGVLHRPDIVYSVVPQAWTLSVELYLSLLFPLLMLLIRRAEPLFVAIILLLPVHHYFLGYNPYPLLTVGIVHFMLGMMLARNRERLADIPLLRSAWGRASFFILGVVCLSARHVINAPLKVFNPFGMTLWDVSAFGSFIVVWAALISAPFQRLLCLPWMQWLGRVSYSLYLIHMLVLYLLVPRLLELGNSSGLTGPAAWLFGLGAAIVLSLALAEIFYRAIEHPCTHLARRIAKRRAGGAPVALGTGAAPVR